MNAAKNTNGKIPQEHFPIDPALLRVRSAVCDCAAVKGLDAKWGIGAHTVGYHEALVRAQKSEGRRGVVLLAVMFIVGFVALAGYIVGAKHPGLTDAKVSDEVRAPSVVIGE